MIPYLDHIRRNLGLAEGFAREFSLQEKAYLRVALPDWAFPPGEGQSSLFWRLMFERRILLTAGTVCWSVLIHANKQLFEPGEGDFSALVVYSLDPFFEEAMGELEKVAGVMRGLKGSKPKGKRVALLENMISDESGEICHVSLPRTLTGGREVFMSDVLLFRKHLPVDFLAEPWLPILVRQQDCRNVMVVPSHYWPPQLIEFWT